MRRRQGTDVVQRGDLVQRARSGDREAYLQLFDEYGQAVLETIAELAPDADDHEELLLQVFEAVLLEEPPELSAEFSLCDWLLELTYVAAS